MSPPAASLISLDTRADLPEIISRDEVSSRFRKRKAGAMRRILFVALLLPILVGISAFPATAQDETPSQPPHNNAITANPFLLLFNWWNVEYERRIASNSTIGVTGSYSEEGDGDKTKYMGGYLLYRYYPSATALEGFYFGGRLGVTQVSDSHDDDTSFGVGLEIGYTWLLGKKKNFVLSLGAGATRLFGDKIDGSVEFLPIVRIANIGVAF